MSDITKISLKEITADNFDDLVEQIRNNFTILENAGYLYKGDMGETPQIVSRPLFEADSDGKFTNWTDLGRNIIKAIFNASDEDINKTEDASDTSVLSKKVASLKLFENISETESIPYSMPWWCADGEVDYPIFPAADFIYMDPAVYDSEKNPITLQNEDKEDINDWSCTLVPVSVTYEEAEPNVTYKKTYAYPTFYYSTSSVIGDSATYCWKINGVETNIPASIANESGELAGKLWLTNKDGQIYGPDNKNTWGWQTIDNMTSWKMRTPAKGDIGYIFSTSGSGTSTTATLGVRVYNGITWEPEDANNDYTVTYDSAFMNAVWNTICNNGNVDISVLSISINKHTLATSSSDVNVLTLTNNNGGSSKLYLDNYKIYNKSITSAGDDDELKSWGEIREAIDTRQYVSLALDKAKEGMTKGTLCPGKLYKIIWSLNIYLYIEALTSSSFANSGYMYSDKLQSLYQVSIMSDLSLRFIKDEENNITDYNYISDGKSIFSEGCKNNKVFDCENKVTLGKDCMNNTIYNCSELALPENSSNNTFISCGKLSFSSYVINSTFNGVNIDNSITGGITYSKALINRHYFGDYSAINCCELNSDSLVKTPALTVANSNGIGISISGTKQTMSTYNWLSGTTNPTNLTDAIPINPILYAGYVSGISTSATNSEPTQNYTSKYGTYISKIVKTEHTNSGNYKGYEVELVFARKDNGYVNLQNSPIILTNNDSNKNCGQLYITSRSTSSITVAYIRPHRNATNGYTDDWYDSPDNFSVIIYDC